MKKKETKFSVALGLFDYINPICYSVTTILIIINLYLGKVFNTIFIIGTIISLIFGLMIPTVKLLVGLGKLKFKMPVNLVFYVNSGILLSGISLLKYVFNINTLIIPIIFTICIILLLLIYNKSRKFNTVAVLTGAIGYIFIYASLISLAIKSSLILPIILYGLAICFFISLCLIGIKADLKDARVHWVIETCNVLCQACVAIGTILLF